VLTAYHEGTMITKVTKSFSYESFFERFVLFVTS